MVVAADAAQRRRITRTGAITAVILLLAYSIDYIDRFGISMALPAIGREFGLSKTSQGLLVTAFALVYMICQIPAGMVVDRIGSRALLLGALIMWSVFTLMTAVTTTFALLLVVRGLFGASQGFFPAASFKTIAERTTPRNRGTVMSVVLAAAGVGSSLSPLLMGPLLEHFGWRGAFLWLAGTGALLGVVLLLLLPKPLSIELRDAERPVPPSAKARRAVLRSPRVWLLAGVFCAANFVTYGLITWVPTYLQLAKGISIGKTGVLASIPMATSVFTTIAGGFLFDRYFRDNPRWYLCVTLGIGGIFLIPMAAADSANAFIVWETCASFVAGLGSGALVALPMRLLPSTLTGTGMGVFNFGGQVAGVAAPLLLGIVMDKFSYAAAFGLLACSCLIAAGLALCIPRRVDPTNFIKGALS
ncbi:MFS transporter [Nocardia panacis]|uniref:MFS transporter n=2 Tax=Nocardia panacis TaxID=2340916 RepID=A0A3A4KBP5_9NOCA|nr:MFS transporter [Nocardia panacis]